MGCLQIVPSSGLDICSVSQKWTPVYMCIPWRRHKRSLSQEKSKLLSFLEQLLDFKTNNNNIRLSNSKTDFTIRF